MNVQQVGVVTPRVDAHVVPAKGLWAVKMERIQGYSGLFQTQIEATSYAMGLARMAASSVILHNRQGQFRAVWNYATDPRTPRIRGEGVK